MKTSGALFAVFLNLLVWAGMTVLHVSFGLLGSYDCASCEFQIVGVHMTVLHVGSRLLGLI